MVNKTCDDYSNNIVACQFKMGSLELHFSGLYNTQKESNNKALKGNHKTETIERVLGNHRTSYVTGKRTTTV